MRAPDELKPDIKNLPGIRKSRGEKTLIMTKMANNAPIQNI